MEALAVMGVVGGLISGFHAGYELYQAWRKKRKASNRALKSSLSTSGSVVSKQYDEGLRIHGKRFAQGDGESLEFSPCENISLTAL